jgi:WD40 repeat protein
MAIINPNILAVGTSTGTVLLFEISSNGTNIEVVNELVEKYLRGGIANMAVDSSGDYLSCSDTLGNIAVWNVKSHKNIKLVHHFENKQ